MEILLILSIVFALTWMQLPETSKNSVPKKNKSLDYDNGVLDGFYSCLILQGRSHESAIDYINETIKKTKDKVGNSPEV